MTKALVIAERAGSLVELAAGARTMADEVVVAAIGGIAVADGIADTVAVIALPEGAPFDAAADTVVEYAASQGFDIVLAEPTRHVKTIVGKLAFANSTAVMTDVMSIEGGIATNMYFGGVGVKSQKTDGLALYTVGAGVFADAEASGENAMEEIAFVEPACSVKLVASEPVIKSGVDLTKASVVVSAGRGIATEEGIAAAQELAAKLGGGLGCTRPVTEGADLLPSELYIGVSGLMLAPRVYIALGVSGQMQHMVGCNRADVLFAVNKDKNAPIFRQADYGLIGDANAIMSEMIAAL